MLDDSPMETPDKYQQIKAELHQLGWNQILFGRWSNKWRETYDKERKQQFGRENSS
jgi:hypothetical protein